MIDNELPPPVPRETSLPAPVDPPKRWYTRPWLITWIMAIGGGLLIVAGCSATQVFFGPLMTLTSGMMNQMDIVGSFEVVDDYMIAMHYGDAERAHRFYSEEARQDISLADVEAELNGENADLYANYDGWDLGESERPRQVTNPGATTVEDAMEGMRIHFDGILYNFSGRDQYFRAEVVFEQGDWKLDKLDLLDGPIDD